MLDDLLPQPITNTYRGAPLAKWAFVLVTVLTLGRSLLHIFLPDGGAGSIATIPLDSFVDNAAAVVIHIFAQWGLSQLLFGLLYVLVLWCYQSLIPLMYLLIFVEYTGRLLIGLVKPFETSETAPGAAGNIIIIPLSLVMLYLALQKRPQRERP